jgi:hypothetical protein
MTMPWSRISKRDNCGDTPNDDGEPLVSIIMSWQSFGLRRVKPRVFEVDQRPDSLGGTGGSDEFLITWQLHYHITSGILLNRARGSLLL